MCKASPRQGKKFQAIIEFLGIRTVLTNDRKKFVKIISKNFTCNLILPSIGPVFVAPNRVNFTIMAKVSEGLSPWPTWKVGQPLRVALTGSKFGPGLYDIIISLGKDDVGQRLGKIL